MKRLFFVLPLLGVCLTSAAQDSISVHRHAEDSADIFYRHMQLNELTVTGVTGNTKLKYATAPVTVVSAADLRSVASANIIDAIARQPGISQLTTGSGISKPVIRGLGYNRVVVMSEGVRQEGQQWGDEHGIEVDGGSVHSVEILKGPASLMYGSDAMAGVVILHSRPVLPEGELRGGFNAEYQTNNGLMGYSLNMGGNHRGFVWEGSWSGKRAHAYENRYDGYVPGSQFKEMSGRAMLGLQKQWGHTRLIGTLYHQTPGIIEGVRDARTGDLASQDGWRGHSYGKWLPYQQVRHYKLVWDNAVNFSHGTLKAVVGYQQNRRQEYEEAHHHEHEGEEHEHEEEGEEHEHEHEEHGHEEHAHGGEEAPALDFKLHTVTYDLRYLTREFSGWKLSGGVQGMWQKSLNLGVEFLIPAYNLFDVGVYATASKQLKRWTLSGGVRWDRRHLHGEALEEEGALRFANFSRNFNGVTGSVGAVWNVNDRLNLRLNAARGFRAPNMSELGSNGAHEGALRYEKGNLQLKPEYSLQFDLGLDFTSRYVTTQLALFANRIDNYIFLRGERREIDGHPVYGYTQGDARLLGFEAGVDVHPIHALHIENTFSYVDGRLLNQPEESKHLPYTPAPRWSAKVKWEILHHSHPTMGRHAHHTHRAKGLSADNLYIAAGTDYWLKQSRVYAVDGTETETPGYVLVNLSAGTDLTWKGKKIAELHVIADNLLNQAYQSHLSRLKYADLNCATGRQGVYNMGRNITLKLTVPVNIF